MDTNVFPTATKEMLRPFRPAFLKRPPVKQGCENCLILFRIKTKLLISNFLLAYTRPLSSGETVVCIRQLNRLNVPSTSSHCYKRHSSFVHMGIKRFQIAFYISFAICIVKVQLMNSFIKNDF